MRFLLDENLSPALSPLLVASGHEAVHVRELGLAGASDAVVLDAARSDRRVLVSSDTDFGELLTMSGTALPSVILFRRNQDRSAAAHAALLLENLPQIEDDLAKGAIVIIEATRVRVRSLPIGGQPATLPAVTSFIQDYRWDLFETYRGLVEGQPIRSINDLRRFANQCAELLDTSPPDGAGELLRVARSLFVHAWLDVDLFTVCASVSLQAVETVVRQMYPNDSDVPYWELVDRIEQSELFPAEILEIVRNGIELRDQLARPLGVVDFGPEITASILIVSHRFVAILGHLAA